MSIFFVKFFLRSFSIVVCIKICYSNNNSGYHLSEILYKNLCAPNIFNDNEAIADISFTTVKIF